MNNMQALKYGISGALENSWGIVKFLILAFFMSASNITELVKIEGLFTIFYLILTFSAEGRFYVKEYDNKGIALLTYIAILNCLVFTVISVMVKDYGYFIFTLWYVPVALNEYIKIESLRLKRKHYTLINISSILGFATTLLLSFILLPIYIERDWKLVFTIELVSFIIFEFLPRIILFKIDVKKLLILKEISLKSLTEELRAIVVSIYRRFDVFLFSELGAFISISLSLIKIDPETLVSYIMLTKIKKVCFGVKKIYSNLTTHEYLESGYYNEHRKYNFTGMFTYTLVALVYGIFANLNYSILYFEIACVLFTWIIELFNFIKIEVLFVKNKLIRYKVIGNLLRQILKLCMGLLAIKFNSLIIYILGFFLATGAYNILLRVKGNQLFNIELQSES